MYTRIHKGVCTFMRNKIFNIFNILTLIKQTTHFPYTVKLIYSKQFTNCTKIQDQRRSKLSAQSTSKENNPLKTKHEIIQMQRKTPIETDQAICIPQLFTPLSIENIVTIEASLARAKIGNETRREFVCARLVKGSFIWRTPGERREREWKSTTLMRSCTVFRQREYPPGENRLEPW